MGVCEKCKRLGGTPRQGDQVLCSDCEADRVAGLACEQQHPRTRSATRNDVSASSSASREDAPASSTTTNDVATESSSSQRPVNDNVEQPSAGQESGDDKAQSSRVNQTAYGDAAGSTPPAETLGNHCMENCRFQRSETGDTSNGSWRQGIKGEMTCTVYVAVVWNIIYWIMMIITLFTEWWW